MTCVQPNCKYQFCWDCAGDYHTSSQCNRPKIKIENNSILAFDELDRQCANFFLARKVALAGKKEIERILSQKQYFVDITKCRLISEGWSLLAIAQSALAHTCIVMFNVKSTKINFLYENQRIITQKLQQKFEEVYIKIDSFPYLQAKLAIYDLRIHLKDYLISIKSEIILEKQKLHRNYSELRKSPSRNSSNKIRSMSDATESHHPNSDYYDIVDRISTFSMNEKSLLASTVFGDEFGSTWRMYKPL